MWIALPLKLYRKLQLQMLHRKWTLPLDDSNQDTKTENTETTNGVMTICYYGYVIRSHRQDTYSDVWWRTDIIVFSNFSPRQLISQSMDNSTLPGKVPTLKHLQHHRALGRPLSENKVEVCLDLTTVITDFLTEVKLPWRFTRLFYEPNKKTKGAGQTYYWWITWPGPMPLNSGVNEVGHQFSENHFV